MDIETKKHKLSRYFYNKLEIENLKKIGGMKKRIEVIKKENEEVLNGIHDLESPVERLVLENRYLMNKSYKETAADIHYSESQTRRIEDKAIKNIKI